MLVNNYVKGKYVVLYDGDGDISWNAINTEEKNGKIYITFNGQGGHVWMHINLISSALKYFIVKVCCRFFFHASNFIKDFQVFWTAKRNSVGMKDSCSGVNSVIPHFAAAGVDKNLHSEIVFQIAKEYTPAEI